MRIYEELFIIKPDATEEEIDLVRVRMGIHPGHPVRDGAEFVLAPLGRARMKELDDFVGFAADAVRSIIAEGVEMAMTKFNRRAPGLNKEEA
jgi:peptidyl-tRNA hydrolase, PTH1 family